MTIDDYLQAMKTTFTPERTRGKRIVLQYVFSGSQSGVCHAVIDDGALCVAHGAHPNPTATVCADFDLWMRILVYAVEPLLAYQSGLYSIVGDIDALMESDTWFQRPQA